MLPSMLKQRLARQTARAIRAYGSASSSHGEHKFPVEGFTSIAWKLGAVGLVGVVAWGEWDRRATEGGQREHPMTRFIADMQPEAKMWEDRNAKHYALAQDAAEEQLLLKSAGPAKMRRLTDPMAFDRGSPFGVAVGSQVDLSDLKIRTDTTV
ncbi:hypothetical protein THASP1DRAFT_33876 [Thamnocephalis sphaerospora]|uniref:Uncharacterized protein n=1 Tax=Thamnocephalis sphaerospora TaxID=78915 RepID=A0A4P9XGS1_9FUNG|nr:hypothetical protein THASP1DRAFT_33876 [Thamnocephalis sphaerospora]|eukprot:RKP04370.1 hypothetical protein THASP1DRAFT_33876 [Thamnocephalis sphaerospora]